MGSLVWKRRKEEKGNDFCLWYTGCYSVMSTQRAFLPEPLTKWISREHASRCTVLQCFWKDILAVLRRLGGHVFLCHCRSTAQTGRCFSKWYKNNRGFSAGNSKQKIMGNIFSLCCCEQCECKQPSCGNRLPAYMGWGAAACGLPAQSHAALKLRHWLRASSALTDYWRGVMRGQHPWQVELWMLGCSSLWQPHQLPRDELQPAHHPNTGAQSLDAGGFLLSIAVFK